MLKVLTSLSFFTKELSPQILTQFACARLQNINCMFKQPNSVLLPFSDHIRSPDIERGQLIGQGSFGTVFRYLSHLISTVAGP
jgi:hypothetical protein